MPTTKKSGLGISHVTTYTMVTTSDTVCQSMDDEWKGPRYYYSTCTHSINSHKKEIMSHTFIMWSFTRLSSRTTKMGISCQSADELPTIVTRYRMWDATLSKWGNWTLASLLDPFGHLFTRFPFFWLRKKRETRTTIERVLVRICQIRGIIKVCFALSLLRIRRRPSMARPKDRGKDLMKRSVVSPLKTFFFLILAFYPPWLSHSHSSSQRHGLLESGYQCKQTPIKELN